MADLLKNYLFGRSGHHLASVISSWDQLTAVLADAEITRFMRHYWISKYGVVRDRALYRAMVGKIKSEASVLSFAKELHSAGVVYAALKQPQSDLWNDFDTDFRARLDALNTFGVELVNVVLLAAQDCLDDNTFDQIVRLIMVFSFRYNVICGKPGTPLESAFHRIAVDIRLGRVKTVSQVFDRLRDLYPDDSEFKIAFRDKSVRDSKLVVCHGRSEP